MQKLFDILKTTIVTPQSYGLFHIISLVIMVELVVLLLINLRNDTDKKFRTKIAIFWVIILLFELYKQWWENTNDLGQWESYYDWYYLPYQFCSTPLYVLPLVAFLKNSKARDAIMAFTSFYCMFGGIAVMIYPGDVFIESLGISIQTMVHHGLQFVTGLYIAAYNRKKLSFTYYLRSLIVLVVFVAVAFGLNELLHDKDVNYFFISRYGTCNLPIVSLVQPHVHWSLFVLIYLFGFALVGFIVYLIEFLFFRMLKKN